MFELQSCHGVQISRDSVVIITKKAVIYLIRCIYVFIYVFIYLDIWLVAFIDLFYICIGLFDTLYICIAIYCTGHHPRGAMGVRGTTKPQAPTTNAFLYKLPILAKTQNL